MILDALLVTAIITVLFSMLVGTSVLFYKERYVWAALVTVAMIFTVSLMTLATAS